MQKVSRIMPSMQVLHTSNHPVTNSSFSPLFVGVDPLATKWKNGFYPDNELYSC